MWVGGQLGAMEFGKVLEPTDFTGGHVNKLRIAMATVRGEVFGGVLKTHESLTEWGLVDRIMCRGLRQMSQSQ
jgi:hypothetical protein